MYVPPAFAETDPEVLWGIASAFPFGLLISQNEGLLTANQIPFEVRHGADGTKLCAHCAKANKIWHDLEGQDVLVVFQGANAYVSPQWYESKREHGRVVPTWNYATVQVRGRARITHDPQWLLEQVTRLTNRHEGDMGQGERWQVADAPKDYIQSQLKGIVGIEIAVTGLTGKLKLSQNRSAADRSGVAAGLEGLGGEQNLAIAALVRDAKT